MNYEKGIITQHGGKGTFVAHKKGKMDGTPRKPSKKTLAKRKWMYSKNEDFKVKCYKCGSPMRESSHIKLFMNKIYNCTSKSCHLNIGESKRLWPIWIPIDKERVFTDADLHKAMAMGHLDEANIQHLRGSII